MDWKTTTKPLHLTYKIPKFCGWNSTLFEIIGGGIKLIKNVFLSFYRLVKKYKHKSMDWKGGEGWGGGRVKPLYKGGYNAQPPTLYKFGGGRVYLFITALCRFQYFTKGSALKQTVKQTIVT